MADITIFHNPACATSRNVLAPARSSGVEPVVVESLKTPPARTKRVELLAVMGIGVRDQLRRKETPCEALKPDEAHWIDHPLIDSVVASQILMNRPVVVSPLGTRLCRPWKTVLDRLPNPQRGVSTQEGGEAVVDAQGRRVVS